MRTEFFLLIIFLLTGSGFFLRHVLKFHLSLVDCVIPFFTALLAMLIALQLRSFPEAIIFLLATIGQFTSFILVSRLRQKGSFFWHALASLGANGTWYMTMRIINNAQAYWMLFIIFIAGIIAGRLLGVNWAKYIENKFHLKADATRDPRMSPEQRWHYIKKEWVFWVLTSALVIDIVYSGFNLTADQTKSLLVVVGLGFLQNLFYALNTRAANRSDNWYIAVTGILSGITFYISAAYLFSKDMPMALLIPYVLSTSLGSTIGAFFSMIIEWARKLKPDAHLGKKTGGEFKTSENKKLEFPWKERLPYSIIIILAVTWLFFQEPLFKLLGYPLNSLRFPLSVVTGKVPRIIIILTATLLFLLDTALHTLTSRAGNRNHTGYHITTLIPKGLVDFFKSSYMALNDRIPDIVPVAVLASCLGSLFGKDIAEYIEKRLQARMDETN